VAAGKNGIINGALDYFQRGTSGSVGSSSTYTADRWQSVTYAGGTMNWSQVATSNTPVGSKYALRIQRPASATNTATMNIATTLETSESLRFAGQTVTVSFWARAGANYSPTSSLINAILAYGTGTDQSYWGGLTGAVNITAPTFTLTTSWQRFSFTASVPSSATELAFVLYSSPTGTAGAADYFDFTLVQLELGSVATAFSRAGGTLQGELNACMRYYWRLGGTDVYERFGSGSFTASTPNNGNTFVQSPVPMRAAPTVLDYSHLAVYDANSVLAVTAATLASAGKLGNIIQITIASGGTAYRPYQLLTNNTTSGYLGLGAEL
jgi:hypothetical protein